MDLTDKEFYAIVDFMKKNYGIELEKKRNLVHSRMENYLTRNGYTSYGQYLDMCKHDPNGIEAEYLVNMLTTNHTFFLREPVHFNFMRDEALPWIKEKEKLTKDVRIWSAAASSGEEAYTISMVLNDYFGIEADKWELSVLATDISHKALAAAQEGIYGPEHIKGVPERWVGRYFVKTDDCRYQIKKEMRDRVIFRYFNLMEPLPFRRKFHIIFLRNVMIYFNEETKAQLLKKLAGFIEPGGYLFIGVTESIETEGTGLEYVEPSIYRKVR